MFLISFILKNINPSPSKLFVICTVFKDVSHIAMYRFGCLVLIGILRHMRHFISYGAVFYECRKEIGYALTTLPNWLKKLVPFFFIQWEVKPKQTESPSRAFQFRFSVMNHYQVKLARVIFCVRSFVINLVLNWFYDTCLKTAQTDMILWRFDCSAVVSFIVLYQLRTQDVFD